MAHRRFSLLCSLLVLVCAASASAEDIQASANTVQANVFGRGSEDLNVAVVEKAKRQLSIVRLEGDKPVILVTHPVLTGKIDGDKTVEGDERTPEGIYYVVSHQTSKELIRRYGSYAEIYGNGAFPLNYPNIFDKIQKKTGHGIWLHGLNPIEHKPATQGCVAMENDSFDNVSTYAGIGMPVVITEHGDYTDQAGYDAERARLLKRFDDYIAAWEGNDFEQFASFIHDKFRTTAGMRKDAFLARKKALMQAVPERSISTSNLKIFKENDTEVLYDFEQFYCAPNIISHGNKRLYFLSDAADMQIVAEEFRPAPYDHIINAEADKFVSVWKNAWEAKDLSAYIALYDAKFRNRAMNKDAWQTYKADLFGKTEIITVGVSDIKVRALGPVRYEVSFIQDYQADAYSDRGRKTLTLVGCPGAFTIISENWMPL